ncbi:hypothetical protein [Flavobacterium sp. GT3R68]|uniref:hypothetical protein n=1 Tax=Flavobacterium sp. GT3R68 TaxID=2594437 RepID=UPI0013155175|nr:hypothetical protein [Flavobacterium sp. GT3R68]
MVLFFLALIAAASFLSRFFSGIKRYSEERETAPKNANEINGMTSESNLNNC